MAYHSTVLLPTCGFVISAENIEAFKRDLAHSKLMMSLIHYRLLDSLMRLAWLLR